MLEKVVSIDLDVVSSTNTYAKEHYGDFDWDKVTRITADAQTAGKGRLNRTWLSPNQGNIYLTYFFTCAKPRAQLGAIGLLFALKIAKLLTRFPVRVSLKWPNDVLVDGKKVAGVLCETIDLRGTFGFILGAGINVNMHFDTLKHVSQPATSLYVALGVKQSVPLLIEQLDTFFQQEYSIYQTAGFDPFAIEYQTFLSHQDAPLWIRRNGVLLSGTFHSLHPDGRLKILLANGEVETVSSADIVTTESQAV